MAFNLSEIYVEAADRELGANLPLTYRLAMLIKNGGEIETDEDVWQLYPIADTSDKKRLFRTVNHIIRETKSCKEWSNFPDNALAIGDNGCGDKLIFLRNDANIESIIYIWHHESGEIVVLANDFHELKVV